MIMSLRLDLKMGLPAAYSHRNNNASHQELVEWLALLDVVAH